MGYREYPLAARLAAGPYAELTWDHRHTRRDVDSHSVTGSPFDPRNEYDRSSDERRDDSFLLELGIRPVLRLHRRLLLETRLGSFVRWSRRRDKLDRRVLRETSQGVEEERSRSRTRDDGWSTGLSDDGPRTLAVLRFLITY